MKRSRIAIYASLLVMACGALWLALQMKPGRSTPERFPEPKSEDTSPETIKTSPEPAPAPPVKPAAVVNATPQQISQMFQSIGIRSGAPIPSGPSRKAWIQIMNQVEANPSLVHARDGSGRTLLHRVAGSKQRTALFKLLLRLGADPEALDNAGRTPMHEAADSLSPDHLKILLEKGGDINVRSNDGMTPLIVSARRLQLPHSAPSFIENAMLQFLLDRGADVNAQDERGDFALKFAAFGGRPESVALLLDAGADINAQTKGGATALHWAAQLTHYNGQQPYRRIIQSLISHGADVNAQDNKGQTPLHYAARVSLHNDTEQAIRLLLRNGARVDIQDANDKTPEQLATGQSSRFLLRRHKRPEQ